MCRAWRRGDALEGRAAPCKVACFAGSAGPRRHRPPGTLFGHRDGGSGFAQARLRADRAFERGKHVCQRCMAAQYRRAPSCLSSRPLLHVYERSFLEGRARHVAFCGTRGADVGPGRLRTSDRPFRQGTWRLSEGYEPRRHSMAAEGRRLSIRRCRRVRSSFSSVGSSACRGVRARSRVVSRRSNRMRSGSCTEALAVGPHDHRRRACGHEHEWGFAALVDTTLVGPVACRWVAISFRSRGRSEAPGPGAAHRALGMAYEVGE